MLSIQFTKTISLTAFAFVTLLAAKTSAQATLKPTQDKDSAPQAIVRNVVVEVDKKILAVTGEVVVEAVDGGLLLLANDGRMTLAQPEQIKRNEISSVPFVPITAQALGDQLLREMPQGFKILITKQKHYVICYNTTDAYAQWTGELFERLYQRFYVFWKNRNLPLDTPRFPMPALVFETRESYLRYAVPELKDAAQSMIGYYHIPSNRVTMFDQTGTEGRIPPGTRVSKIELINEIFSQPQAERTVATILHEAVHQLAFNSGLQTRLADYPLWVSEGLAVYFESPNLNSSNGIGAIGKVNEFNREVFRRYLYLSRDDRQALELLLSGDTRFTDATKAREAYAESWALTYYLLNARTKEYVAYLKYLASQPPGQRDRKQRIVDVQAFFGKDLEALDREFIQYIRKRM